MGAKDSTSTSTMTPPPYVAAAYKDLIKTAKPISQTPYEAFSGGSSNPMQQTAQGQIQGLAGNTNPNFTNASSLLNSTASTPTSSLIGGYENPFQQDVINATMANIGETNAQQQQQVIGNAIQKGAMGGDRVGVAQAELARQQGLAGDATLANLNAQNYAQALAAAQAQKSQQVEQAGAMGTLGQTENTTGLQNAAAALSAGDSQYARDYSMYQAARSYPFEKTSWLANIVEGVGSGSGGTTTATQPAGNTGSSILGGVLALGSFLSDERAKENRQIIGKTFDGQPIYRFNYKGDPRTQLGLMAQEVEKDHPHAVNENAQGLKFVDYRDATEDAARRKHFAEGGLVPYETDMTARAGMKSPDSYMGGSYVPQVAELARSAGATLPQPVAPQKQDDPLSRFADKAMQDAQQKGADNIKGLIRGAMQPSPSATAPQESMHAGGNGVAPIAAGATLPPPPVPAAAGASGASGGGLANLAHLFGFADGGLVGQSMARRGYADGSWAMPAPASWDDDPGAPAFDNRPPVSAAPPIVVRSMKDLPKIPDWPAYNPAGTDAAAGQIDELLQRRSLTPFADMPKPAPVARGLEPAPIEPVAAPKAPEAYQGHFDAAGNLIPQTAAEIAQLKAADAPGAIPSGKAYGDAVPGSNGVAPNVPTLPDAITVPTLPPVHAVSENGVAPIAPAPAPEDIMPKAEAARVARGQPVAVARLPGAAPAGGQNWVQNLQNAGLPPMQAAIMAGNMQVESSFRPDAWNRKEDAHGAMQWEGDRWDKGSPNSLQTFAAKAGKDWRDPQVQSDFIRWEGENIPRLKSSWNQFLAAKTPQDAQKALAGFIGYKPGNDGQRLAAGLALMQDPGDAAVKGGSYARYGAPAPEATGSAGLAAAAPAAAGSNGVAPIPGAAAAEPAGGILGTGDLLQKIGIHLSDNQRTALLSAGLGMMAGTSPNFLTNVGTGGLKGVEQMNLLKTQGFEGRRVDIAAGELARQAAQTKADIAQTEAGTQQTKAQTAQTGVQTQIMRYDYSRGPYGMMVIDKTDPSAGVQLIRPGDIATSPIAQAAIQQRRAAGIPDNGQYASPPATTPAGPAPIAAPPAAAAPVVVVPASPTAGLIPPIPRAAVDPRGLYPEGQATMMAEQKEGLARAEGEYQGAQESRVQTQQMRQAFDALPKSGMLTQGPLLQAGLGFAGVFNNGMRILGAPGMQINPEAVAAGEDLNKLTKQAGFTASAVLGKGEAASTIDKVLSAIPGGANSPQGAQLILKTIESAQQRKIDHYQFLQNWVQAGNPSLFGAEDYFNRANPPQMYGVMALSGPSSIALLRQHPDTLPQFAQKWGPEAGALAKRYVLGQQ